MPFTRSAILIVDGLYEVTITNYKVSDIRKYGHDCSKTDR